MLLVLQGLAVADVLPVGPFDTVGSLAIWPLRVNLLDLVAPVIAIVIAVLGVLLLDRVSVEQIDRRSALVAQLRFAVTMQDLRTVTLLRRQLSNELPRRDPWFTVHPGRLPAWRRSLRSLARFPSKRLGRMVLLAAFAGGAELAAFKGTSPAILIAGGATFLLGLDAVEPFAQELDHPELTERYPMEAPRLQQRLLVAPALLLIVASLIGALTAFLLDGNLSTLAIGAILAPPAALAGGIAAAFNTAERRARPAAPDRRPIAPAARGRRHEVRAEGAPAVRRRRARLRPGAAGPRRHRARRRPGRHRPAGRRSSCSSSSPPSRGGSNGVRCCDVGGTASWRKANRR